MNSFVFLFLLLNVAVDTNSCVEANKGINFYMNSDFPNAMIDISESSNESVKIQASIERLNTRKCHEQWKNWYADTFQLTSSHEKKLTSSAFFNCFWEHPQIFKLLDGMVSSYPHLIHKFNLSITFEGRLIPGYKISNPIKNNNLGRKKFAIYIQGMLHAREWISTPTILYIMASLIDGYKAKDKRIQKVLEDYDWYFVPLINIDGYKYTWTNDRYWRKNRRRILGTSYVGVDLNRNYGPLKDFCKNIVYQIPYSEGYCGKYPFSEPEIFYINKWMLKHPEIKASFDVHSCATSIYVPSAATELISIADGMLKNINSIHTDFIYTRKMTSTGGTFKDNQYTSFSYRPSFTMELRGHDFIIDPIHIQKSGQENLRGFLYFAETLHK